MVVRAGFDEYALDFTTALLAKPAPTDMLQYNGNFTTAFLTILHLGY